MKQSQRGLSFVELLIVMVFLGIFTAVAVPSLSSTDSSKLDLAAEEIAEAIRFARSESIRSQIDFAIEVKHTTGKITLSKPTISGGNISGGNITGSEYLLRHPIDKQYYDFFVQGLPRAKGVKISNVSKPFSFAGLINPQEICLFDREGRPYFLNSGSSHYLTNGAITLDYRGHTKQVALSSFGRVTITQ